MPMMLNSKPKCDSTSTHGCGVSVSHILLGMKCTFTHDCTSLEFYITAVSCDIAWQQQITKLCITMTLSKLLKQVLPC